MKKIGFKLIFIAFAIFTFVFAVNISVNAEQINEENDEIVETVEPEVSEQAKEVSFAEMFDNFIEEWLPAILAVLGGGTGAGVVVALATALFKKLAEEVRKSSEANKESNQTLSKAQAILADGLDNIGNKVEELSEKYAEKFEESIGTMTDCINKIDFLAEENKKFKELIALMVSSNRELITNGYATKILELLNEGSDSNEQK